MSTEQTLTTESDFLRKDSPNIGEYLNWYQHSFYCSNCHTNNHRYIRKGVEVRYIGFACDKCGCRVKG